MIFIQVIGTYWDWRDRDNTQLEFHESGLFVYGKPIEWDQIQSVKAEKKGDIKIHLKGGKTKLIFYNAFSRTNEEIIAEIKKRVG